MKASLAKSAELKSAVRDVEVDLKIELPEAIKAEMAASSQSSTDVLIKALSDSKFKAKTTVNRGDKQKTSAELSYEGAAGSIKLDTKMLLDGTVMTIKSPFSDRYVVTDLKEEMKDQPGANFDIFNKYQDKEFMKKNLEIIKLFIDKFANKDSFSVSKKTVELPDGKKEIKIITLDLSGDKFLTEIEAMADKALSPDMYDTYKKLFELAKEAGEAPDQVEEMPSKEEFEKQINGVKALYDMQKTALIAKAKEQLVVNKLTFEMGVDENDNNVYSNVVADVKVKDFQGKGNELAVKVNMVSGTGKINAVKDADFAKIEVTDENKITAEEFGKEIEEKFNDMK